MNHLHVRFKAFQKSAISHFYDELCFSKKHFILNFQFMITSNKR